MFQRVDMTLRRMAAFLREGEEAKGKSVSKEGEEGGKEEEESGNQGEEEKK
jgi:hypothetical protein